MAARRDSPHHRCRVERSACVTVETVAERRRQLMQDAGDGFRRRQVPAGQPRLDGEPQGERMPRPDLSSGRNRIGLVDAGDTE
jgi:hypothetical protein